MKWKSATYHMNFHLIHRYSLFRRYKTGLVQCTRHHHMLRNRPVIRKLENHQTFILSYEKMLKSSFFYLTQRLISVEEWFDFSFLILQLTIFDGILPVAGLLFYVEVKTCGTPDRLKTLKNNQILRFS